ncbi:MAG: hypothetical protein EPN84_04315 [Legionella sp.]|nr:MAG: hypothetical protein EPN84_04315 [Legionella sp.]
MLTELEQRVLSHALKVYLKNVEDTLDGNKNIVTSLRTRVIPSELSELIKNGLAEQYKAEGRIKRREIAQLKTAIVIQEERLNINRKNFYGQYPELHAEPSVHHVNVLDAKRREHLRSKYIQHAKTFNAEYTEHLLPLINSPFFCYEGINWSYIGPARENFERLTFKLGCANEIKAAEELLQELNARLLTKEQTITHSIEENDFLFRQFVKAISPVIVDKTFYIPALSQCERETEHIIGLEHIKIKLLNILNVKKLSLKKGDKMDRVDDLINKIKTLCINSSTTLADLEYVINDWQLLSVKGRQNSKIFTTSALVAFFYRVNEHQFINDCLALVRPTHWTTPIPPKEPYPYGVH